MRRLWGLTFVTVVCTALMPVSSETALADASSNGGGVACQPHQDWTGTQSGPQTLTVQGTVAQAPCPLPQVNGSAGSAGYTTSGAPPTPPPDGTACHGDINADVMMSHLHNGGWQVQYFDPNDGQVVTANVGDGPGWPNWPLTGQQLTRTSWALGYSAAEMGSRQNPYILWHMEGKYQGGQCVPDSNGWTDLGGTRQCNPPGYAAPVGAGFPNECLVYGATLGPLPYVAPSFATLTAFVPGLLDNLRSRWQTGTSQTSWLYGGQSLIAAGLGQSIVRYPVCFASAGGNLPETFTQEVLIPQPNPGPALVVDYVISAAVDETVWDFGDGQTQTLTGPVALAQGCPSAQHTYYHVSADVYGSHLNHWLPPGVSSWPFADEPHADMEASVAWHHVGVSVTALAREPDGSTLDQPVAVPASFNNIWLASAPEWQTVGQFESVPCQCTAAPGG